MSSLVSLLPTDGLARFLCDAVWQSTLLGVFGWLIIRSLPQRPAARSCVALLACVLCVAVPVASAVFRANGVGVLSEAESSVARTAPTASEPSIPRNVSDSALEPAPVTAEPVRDPDSRLLASTDDSVEEPGVIRTGERSKPVKTVRETASPFAREVSPWTVVSILWCVAACCLGMRLVRAAAGVRRLCRDATHCDDATIIQCSRRAAQAMQLRTVPPVVVHPQADCPSVVAWFDPQLVIPPPKEPRGEQHWFNVFAHELGHVQRGDGWTRIAVELAVALLPWQPLLWVLRREYRMACEEACDDWAVFAGADPIDFASSLTEWIPRRSPSLAMGISVFPSFVRRRIERLVDGSAVGNPGLGRRWMTISTGVALLLLPGVALLQSGSQPLFGFEPADNAGSTSTVASSPENVNDDLVASGIQPVRGTAQRIPRSQIATLGEGRLSHWNYAEALGFSEALGGIVSCSRDGTLIVWDRESGRAHTRIELPRSARGYRWWNWDTEDRTRFATDQVLSPSGNRVYVSMADGTIRVTDLVTLESHTLPETVDRPNHLAISRDGRRLGVLKIISSERENSVVILDTESGRVRNRVIYPSSEDHRPSWTTLALSPDGERFAVSFKGTVELWDADGDEPLWSVESHPKAWVHDVSFSPDGQLVATGAAAGFAKVLDAASGEEVHAFPVRSSTRAVRFGPDGESLISATSQVLQFFSLSTGEEIWKQYIHQRRTLNSLAISQDGVALAISRGNQIEVRDLTSGDALLSATGIESVAVSPVEDRLVTGHWDGRLAARRLSEFDKVDSWTPHASAVHSLAFSPNGSTLASGASDEVALSNVAAARVSMALREPRRLPVNVNPVLPPQLIFTPDSSQLYSVFSKFDAPCWNIADGKQSGALSRNTSLMPFTPLFITPEDKLVSCSTENRGGVAMWDLTSGKIERSLEKVEAKRGGLVNLTVSRDGRLVAFGAFGHAIRIHDLQSETVIDLKNGHSNRGAVQSLAFSPDNSMLASTAGNGQVVLWNVATGKMLRRIAVGPRGGIVRQVQWSFDGRHLITHNGNGTVSILESDSQSSDES